MIDFEKNCEAKREMFASFEEVFGKKTYNPEDTIILTYPKGEYIDWIREQMGAMLTREISNATLKEP